MSEERPLPYEKLRPIGEAINKETDKNVPGKAGTGYGFRIDQKALFEFPASELWILRLVVEALGPPTGGWHYHPERARNLFNTLSEHRVPAPAHLEFILLKGGWVTVPSKTAEYYQKQWASVVKTSLLKDRQIQTEE